jgi:hypothetical protein
MNSWDGFPDGTSQNSKQKGAVVLSPITSSDLLHPHQASLDVRAHRSIGDLQGGDRVLPDPTVRQLTLDPVGARALIASDGVWDALACGGKGAARRVRNMACTKAASHLRSFSKEARDRDDITVIVADFLPDLGARVPPALAEAVPAAAGVAKGDCESSVASLMNDVKRKVCSWSPAAPQVDEPGPANRSPLFG